MFKAWIIVLLCLSAFASSGVAGEVPFKLEAGRIIIPLKIMGGDAVEAVVSTGSPDSFLSAEFISKRKITLAYTNDGPVTGRNDKIVLFADVPRIIVGDEQPVSLKMKERSLDSISKAVGREIALILGADYFRGKIIQIDFRSSVIRFLENSPTDYKSAKTSADGSGPVSIFLKMDKPVRSFFGVAFNLPVVADISFAGSKMETLIDTGETAPFAISASAAKQLCLSPIPGKGTSKASQIESVSLNGYTINQVPVLIFGKDAGFERDANDIGVVLGIKLLKNFLVTFDWKEKMIVLER